MCSKTKHGCIVVLSGNINAGCQILCLASMVVTVLTTSAVSLFVQMQYTQDCATLEANNISIHVLCKFARKLVLMFRSFVRPVRE